GPTSTLSPTPGEGTPTDDPNVTPDLAGCSYEPEARCISPDGGFWMHVVVEDDTVAQLALAYDTTVPDILSDNGLTEDSFISPGDVLRIRIKVTLTPTLTPTGGPDSTATPTPTVAPPSLLAPARGATVARDEAAVLQWAALRPLPRGASYLVQIRNLETDETFRATTTSNVYRLPASLRPASGASASYEWQVVIVEGSSPDGAVISGQGPAWTVTWGGEGDAGPHLKSNPTPADPPPVARHPLPASREGKWMAPVPCWRGKGVTACDRRGGWGQIRA